MPAFAFGTLIPAMMDQQAVAKRLMSGSPMMNALEALRYQILELQSNILNYDNLTVKVNSMAKAMREQLHLPSLV